MATSGNPERPTPPALFLLLDLPFGAAVGYLMIAVPWWLRQAGLPLDEIAELSAVAFSPHALKILWIPVLDVFGTKKGWYLAMCGASAALLVAASLVPDPARHLGLYTILLTLLQATATTAHAANNALMAITTRLEDKGKVGGYAMASNVGGTNVLGALAVPIAQHVSPRAAGIALAVAVVTSAATALRIVEPRLSGAGAVAGGVLRWLGRRLKEMGVDLWRTIRSRDGFTGLVICLVPVGTGALTNLFAAMAKDYGAGARTVEIVNGYAGGAVAVLGALAGGFLADRVSRRLAYAMAGGLTAASAVAMLVSPMSQATYAWGTLAYGFANGIAFATWAGMVLEMVGHSVATATKYAFFNASSNVAITYTTWLDGQAARLDAGGIRGARAMLAADALLTLGGIAVLLAMVALVRRRGAGAGAARGGLVRGDVPPAGGDEPSGGERG